MKKDLKKLDSLLKGLYQLNEYLGGDKQVDYRDKDTEFNDIIKAFHSEVFRVRQDQLLRKHREATMDRGNTELIRLNHDIRQSITDCTQMLIEAQKRGIRAKSFAKLPSDLQRNMKEQLKNCVAVLQDVKRAQQGEGLYRPPEPVSLNDLKKRLIGDELQHDGSGEEINLDQQAGFQEFNQNDEDMDQRLDRIMELNQQFKQKLLVQGEMIDHTNNQIKKTTQVADRVQKKIEKAENQLLKVLKQYRRPNKLCLDITLIVLILGLIAVIVNMIRPH